jgi:hypothetical protein
MGDGRLLLFGGLFPVSRFWFLSRFACLVSFIFIRFAVCVARREADRTDRASGACAHATDCLRENDDVRDDTHPYQYEREEKYERSPKPEELFGS